MDRTLLTTWIWLIVLSGGSAIIAYVASHGIDRRLVAAVILGLALVKARLILSRYLGLAQAPGWLAGFSWVIGLTGVLIFGLYLIPVFAGTIGHGR